MAWAVTTSTGKAKSSRPIRTDHPNDELLPEGLATPDNFLFTIVDAEGSAVGMLWFAVQTKFNARIAYVFDVSVNPAQPRRGHAARAFRDLEDEVRKRGLSGIALHVFGHNTAARALYTKLGYEPTNISLFKPLTPGTERSAAAG